MVELEKDHRDLERRHIDVSPPNTAPTVKPSKSKHGNHFINMCHLVYSP